MTTTTEIANIAHLLDLSAYAGDFAEDYDWDGIRADYADALTAAAGEGIYVYASGYVVADIDVAETARELDWKEIADGIDVAPIFERHDKSER